MTNVPHSISELIPAVVSRVAETTRLNQIESTPVGAGLPTGETDPRVYENNSYFDVDLAEFPIFSLSSKPSDTRKSPMLYSDEIQSVGGKSIVRTWTVYAGPLGFGGPTCQELLFDLLQIYSEQGCQGSKIHFGTLRSLLMRRGTRHPSSDDYERVKRDITILRGLDFHCKNACWSPKRKAYVDAEWRLFGAVVYSKTTPEELDPDMTEGYIEVSPTFEKMIRSRGFFATSLPSKLFHSLSSMEQRVALYLTKKFLFQGTHKRYFDDLARALPIEAKCPRDGRKILNRAMDRMKKRKLPFLKDYSLKANVEGRYVATFQRGEVPKERFTFPKGADSKIGPDLTHQVERIVDAVGSDKDRFWWTQCAKRLGPNSIERGLGQFKESTRIHKIKNPGGLLSKIFMDIAQERGIVLN